jgi:hypothetical protein
MALAYQVESWYNTWLGSYMLILPRMTSRSVRRKVRKAKAENASLHPPPPRNLGLKDPNIGAIRLSTLKRHNFLTRVKSSTNVYFCNLQFFCNELECLSLASLSSLVGKAGACLSEAPFRCSTLELAPCLIHKHSILLISLSVCPWQAFLALWVRLEIA